METTEKIVEAYVRYVKGWATIPNLRCSGQKEIDLFAIDPATDERWHIETSVSISGGFSALTNEPYEPGEHKQRVKQAGARRKLGFFLAEKFSPAAITEKLCGYGCKEGEVRRAIVTWDWKPGVKEAAANLGIQLWALPDLMREIGELGADSKVYFGDDTLRTITLFVKGIAKAEKQPMHVQAAEGAITPETADPSVSSNVGTRFYVYENWVHKRARLHRGDCSHCKDGKGTQGSNSVANGRWYGPFPTREAAAARLAQINQPNKSECASCGG
jgi:hypothetical protein